jgi:hypothetical protein
MNQSWTVSDVRLKGARRQLRTRLRAPDRERRLITRS